MVTTQGLRRSAATTFSTPSVVALVLVVFLSLFLSLAESSPARARDEGIFDPKRSGAKGFHEGIFDDGFGGFSTLRKRNLLNMAHKRRPEMDPRGFDGDAFTDSTDDELIQNGWEEFGIFGKRDEERLLNSHPLMGRKRQGYGAGAGFIVHRSNPGFLIHKRPFVIHKRPFVIHKRPFLIHKRPMGKPFAMRYNKRLWKPFATYHNLQKRHPFLIHKKNWKPYALSGASKIALHKRDYQWYKKYQQEEKEMKEIEQMIMSLLRDISMQNKDNHRMPDALFGRLKKLEKVEEDFKPDEMELEKRLGTMLDHVQLLYSYRFPKVTKHHDSAETSNDDDVKRQESHHMDSNDCVDKEEENCEKIEKKETNASQNSKSSIRKKRMDEWNASGMDSDTFNSKSR